MAIKGNRPGNSSWQDMVDKRSQDESNNIKTRKERNQRKEERKRHIQARIVELSKSNPKFSGKAYDKTQRMMKQIINENDTLVKETTNNDETKSDIRDQIRMAKAITKGANVGDMTIKRGSTIWQDMEAEKKQKGGHSGSAKKESSINYNTQTNDKEKKDIAKQIRIAEKKKDKQLDEEIKESDIEYEKLPPVTGKPKILFISDVKNWAWWNKAKYLKQYLSDEFEIDIVAVVGSGRKAIDKKRYDLYVTFGYSYVNYLGKIKPHKKVTGVTAHRTRSIIVGQMKKCKWVHANSLMLLNELKKWGIKDAFYVPNGVDEELFMPIEPIPEKRDNIVVGHVGKKNVMKGQDNFILPAIAKANAESYVNVKSYLSKDVIPFHEMYKEYQDIDVFIVSSTEDGTPNPALEAASCGRPIISNAIGNMPEFIVDGYNGFIVERKVDAYVEKINWLRNNRDKMIEMGKNARQTVLDGWTWEHQAENYRNMFRICFRKK